MKPSHDVSKTGDYTSLADSLPEEWRQEFLTFVMSGVASDLFFKFLDSDARAQQAVESAVSHEIRSFNRFAQSLEVDQELIDNYLKRKKRKPMDVAREAISRIIGALLEMSALQSRERREAVSAAFTALSSEQAEDMRHMLDEVRSEAHASISSRTTVDGAHLEMKPTR